MTRFATLAARREACVSTASAAISFAWEVISIHVRAANITLRDTDIAATAVSGGASKRNPMAILAQHSIRTLFCFRSLLSLLGRGPTLCALGLLADRVPLTGWFENGLATLAARRIACVSTAPTAVALAWKVVSISVFAANITLRNADIAAAFVSGSARKWRAIAILALHWRRTLLCFCSLLSLPGPGPILCALGLLADRVPLTRRLEQRLATFAARREACVSTAPAAVALAWKVVAIDVLAANITLSNADIAAALVSTSTRKWGAMAILAMYWWKPPPCFGILLSAHCQERTLFASALAVRRTFRISSRHRRPSDQRGDRKDLPPKCHRQNHSFD